MNVYISKRNLRIYSGGLAVIIANSVEEAYDLIEPEHKEWNEDWSNPQWSMPELAQDLLYTGIGVPYNSEPQIVYISSYAE